MNKKVEETTDLRWLHERGRRAFWAVSIDLLIMLGGVILIGLLVMTGQFGSLPILTVAIMAIAVLQLCRMDGRQKVLRRRFRACAAECRARLPEELLAEARCMEPDFVEAFLWAVECNESHLAGDCPLCGAE